MLVVVNVLRPDFQIRMLLQFVVERLASSKRSTIRNSVRRPSTPTEVLRALPMFLRENRDKIDLLPHNMLFNISLINNRPTGGKIARA